MDNDFIDIDEEILDPVRERVGRLFLRVWELFGYFGLTDLLILLTVLETADYSIENLLEPGRHNVAIASAIWVRPTLSEWDGDAWIS